ncbi:MAG: DUF1259 domain-containing protein [Gemmatimonadota bacterium]|nr:DUF1259 domain-containing protein [Gemmatimonadota bacterium]
MKSNAQQCRRTVLASALLLMVAAATHAQSTPSTPWQEVGRVLQTSDVFASGYHRYNLPRRDLTLRVGDVTVAPALALGAWAGFSGDPNDATMMGDLIVTTTELKPVVAALVRQRLMTTAVHNHLVGEDPRLIYIHFHGEGPAVDMARRLDSVIALTGTPRPVAATNPRPLSIDTSMVFRSLGSSGRAQGDVAQLSFILVPGKVELHHRTVTPALGYGSPINIQMVNPDRAVATGDFAVLGTKVEPMVNALTKNGITVTAVHSHLIDEAPHLYYIHYWADGPLADVLAGLKAALDASH